MRKYLVNTLIRSAQKDLYIKARFFLHFIYPAIVLKSILPYLLIRPLEKRPYIFPQKID